MSLDEIRELMFQIRLELRRAPDAVRDAELDAERADLEADRVFDSALLAAVGNVEERKAQARLAAADARAAAVIARAVFNRAKTKLRALETEMMMLQSVLKSVQLEGA
jgi:hypothetical protein